VALALLCLIFALGPARAEERLRIITSGNYPPFVYADAAGGLSGFEIDLANALCAILGARCEFIDLPFEQTIPALLAGRGEAVVASLSITEERRRLVAFTDRYYRTPIQLVARRGFDRPATEEGLKGVRIAVARGTTSEAYLRARVADATIAAFPTQNEANRALAEGRADLVLADAFAMWEFVRSDPGRRFAPLGGPIYVDEGIGIAVRKADEALRHRLNLAIARLRLDGTYQKINAKYFPFSIY
jgi:ABC-type amino acid transport substrate-binding protein